jgi:hypothetical protein
MLAETGCLPCNRHLAKTVNPGTTLTIKNSQSATDDSPRGAQRQWPKRDITPDSTAARSQATKQQGDSTLGLGGGLFALLLVAGLLYLGYADSAVANADIDGLVIFPAPSRDHLDGDVGYSQDVPPGGPHNPTWLNCGIYDEPVRAENAVHSLEHGAVWLTYRPDLSASQVDLLRDLVRAEQKRLRERLAQFVQRFQKGPFTPEPGADCTFGGDGHPASG